MIDRTMPSRRAALTLSMLTVLATACDKLPGAELPDRLASEAREVTPASAWATNCAGCHGVAGAGSSARGFVAAGYMQSASDDFLQRVITDGQGVMMPAFAMANGGPLTNEQIKTLVQWMRKQMAGESGVAAAVPAEFSAAGGAAAGDPGRGALVFEAACAACHQGERSVLEPDFLQLVSDQGLWSATVFGRTELGMPDWHGPFGGRAAPLHPTEMLDVVAFMSSRRNGKGSTR